jgi:hypothetical protein
MELGREFLMRFGSDDDRRNLAAKAQEPNGAVVLEEKESAETALASEQSQAAQANL